MIPRAGRCFLGSAKVADLDTDAEIVAINRKGEVEPHQRAILSDIEGIVLLDGIWSQAKALWWRNAWTLKCERVILGPKRPSRYGKLRKEPRGDGLAPLKPQDCCSPGSRSDRKLPKRSTQASIECLHGIGKYRPKCRNSAEAEEAGLSTAQAGLTSDFSTREMSTRCACLTGCQCCTVTRWFQCLPEA